MVPSWSTACLDWQERIVARQSLIPFAPLFPDQAQEALDVFGELTMVDATGSPLMKETVRPWVTEFVASIFGAYEPETGRRHINEFLLLISKKNGKSTIAAGIMLTALILNWRPSGEFIILAPTKEIADNSWKPIRDMVKADEELDDLIHVQDHIRTATHRKTGAILKVVAADSDTVSGKKAIGVFIDELWVFGSRANAAAMIREATGGLASRPEGFIIYATTQSDDPPAGIFKSKLDYARKVRDGKIVAKKFLPVLYEFPDAMLEAGDHKKLENAYVTNPNWGLSVDIEFIEEKYSQAQIDGEAEVRGFLAKHMNVEIGLKLASDRWAGADFWEACANPQLTKEELLRRSEVVVAGIDGGGLDDLLGLTLLGRCSETRRWLSWSHAWAHKIVLERRKEIAPRLLDFEKDGDLTFVDKPGQDVKAVADIICEVIDLGLMPEEKGIGVDAAGIGDIVEELCSEARGEPEVMQKRLSAVSQGWRLNSSIKTTERRCAGGELEHTGCALMNWCVGNAKTVPAGNAVTITKQVSGTAKIDPLMSLFDAATLMALNPVAAGGRSFWE